MSGGPVFLVYLFARLRERALRISRWGEGVEEGPVGFAGVEQCAGAVVVEAAEPERDTLDAFDEVVDRLGRSVADAGVVPSDDLIGPHPQGPAEPADLVGHPMLGEVGGDLLDPTGGYCRVGLL